MRIETPPRVSAGLWRRGARQAAVILLLALIPAVLTAWLHPRRPQWSRDSAAVPEVDWAAVEQSRPRVLLIDARNAAAFARGHIPGAVWLGTGPGDDGLVAVARAWQPGVRLVVYCDSARCEAAQAAAHRLVRETGIADVAVLKGGWSAWSEAHQPGR